MEAFLYRNGPLSNTVLDATPRKLSQTPKQPSSNRGANNHNNDGAWRFFPEFCTGNVAVMDCGDSPTQEELNSNPCTTLNNRATAACANHSATATATTKPLNVVDMVQCTSRALGDAHSFDVQQDSFVDLSSVVMDQTSTSLAIHSELLEAQKELAWSWRTRALSGMEKWQVLMEHEKQIGAAWKRFAIAVSNLFAYEKDIESTKLADDASLKGGGKRDIHMPYRKLQKSAVDDCLRIMARHKFERSTPALEALGAMLSSYVADLSSVHPAVQAYLDAIQPLSQMKRKYIILQEQIAKQQQQQQQKTSASSGVHGANRSSAGSGNANASRSFTDPWKAGLQILMGTTAFVEPIRQSPKKQPPQPQSKELEKLHHQIQTFEKKFLLNEALLKEFLTIICKATPVRVARMGYRYFNTEAMQTAMLHSSSVAMRTKLNVASKESIAKMINRHHKEAKEDEITELQIVQRMVNIGNTKKFLKEDADGTTTEISSGVEINNDTENDEAHKAQLRDEALRQTRERIGRWNAKLALAIMEAVGVDDANVRVEETTRDLRMIRKYAIGLRESVQRCAEALDVLRLAILQGPMGDIRDIRHDFVKELCNLLAAVYLPTDDVIQKRAAMPNLGVLHGAGIHLKDPSGWRMETKGSCGESVRTYLDCREAGTEWLLDSLDSLLKEYNHRVETVESYVYMECVGIQLEKNFSQARAKALQAFEKKTDITSAINVATRKKMPVLVRELSAKLEAVGQDVSHTTVKETKEAHLESKALKTELHDLAVRRLTRARETSTERVIALMAVWAKGTGISELAGVKFHHSIHLI